MLAINWQSCVPRLSSYDGISGAGAGGEGVLQEIRRKAAVQPNCQRISRLKRERTEGMPSRRKLLALPHGST
jgi:hypothetical protein